MVQINTRSVNREMWNVFYTWTFVFICRIHICIQYIYFFFKLTYKQYQQNEGFLFPNKVHTTLSLNHKKKKRDSQTCNTSIDTTDWEKA